VPLAKIKSVALNAILERDLDSWKGEADTLSGMVSQEVFGIAVMKAVEYVGSYEGKLLKWSLYFGHLWIGERTDTHSHLVEVRTQLRMSSP